MIRAIAAIDAERGIAKQGHIPWHIPEDRRYWKQQSSQGLTLMGRATYEVMPRPLPDRRNLVLSSTLAAVRPGFELIRQLDRFLLTTSEDIWIIGGAQLYAAALQYCDQVYLTLVKGAYDCDRFFPAYAEQYEQIQQSSIKKHEDYQYQFTVFERLKNR